MGEGIVLSFARIGPRYIMHITATDGSTIADGVGASFRHSDVTDGKSVGEVVAAATAILGGSTYSSTQPESRRRSLPRRPTLPRGNAPNSHCHRNLPDQPRAAFACLKGRGGRIINSRLRCRDERIPRKAGLRCSESLGVDALGCREWAPFGSPRMR